MGHSKNQLIFQKNSTSTTQARVLPSAWGCDNPYTTKSDNMYVENFLKQKSVQSNALYF